MAPAQNRETRESETGKDHIRGLSWSRIKKDFVYTGGNCQGDDRQESCSSAGNCQADEQTVITQLSRP